MTPPTPLTIVLPCFNPPAGWAGNVMANVQRIEGYLGFPPALVVVDDGSRTPEARTGVGELHEELPSAKIIRYDENMGKGYALRRGVAEATTPFVIFTDVDFPYTIESFVRIWDALRAGSDVAVGHRDESYYRHVPLARRLISRSFRFVVKHAFRLGTSDTQSGLKGFNERGKAHFLRSRTDRYLFDLEFVRACSRDDGLTLTPVAVEINPGVTFRRMSARVLLTELLNLVRIWSKRPSR
jgi:glycosyltransferase involved in cell wall biosynthesis